VDEIKQLHTITKTNLNLIMSLANSKKQPNLINQNDSEGNIENTEITPSSDQINEKMEP
jgi:hypothetical protein